MQLLAGKTVLRHGVGRNRCGSRRPRLALAHRLCPDSRQTALLIWRPRSLVTSQRLIKKSPLAKWGEVKIVNPVARFPPDFLRVAASSNYPNKPIRMVVPFAAGGPVDLVGRLLIQKLNQDGQGTACIGEGAAWKVELRRNPVSGITISSAGSACGCRRELPRSLFPASS